MAFLEINQVNKLFGKVQALSDISLSVEEGGFLVLVGPSGCGKSTLLNMIAGLEPLSGGSIHINGNDVSKLHPSKRDIAMVFQSYALYPNMTVAQNIGFGMEIRHVPKPERERAIKEVAATLQIEHLLNRKPAQLSGGQRQRVAMGRALVREPQVFLFDEPLSNLDARLRVDMRSEIKKLHHTLGTTIVYVTHDQIEAMTLATQIAVLKDGIVQQMGTPDDIYSQPANTFVADFMGSPAMNHIEGQITHRESGLCFRFNGTDLPIQNTSVGLKYYANKQVLMGIRAEAVTDIDSVDNRSTTIHHISLTVDQVEPTGADTFVITDDDNTKIVARVRNNIKVSRGDRIELSFDMQHAHYFDPSTGQRIV